MNEKPTSFSFYDSRHDDVYNIYLDEFGEFDCATRSVNGVGSSPISYHHLADVPEPHRSRIAAEIARRQLK